MALSDIIARLSVELGLNTAAFEKGATLSEKRLAQSAKRFEAIGKGMSSLGAKLSLSLTAPLAAFGVTAVKAAIESQDALGQVDAALKSMGNAAGRTSEQLQGLATGIMRKSLYDDDEILRKVTANLLTFGNVSGKVFDEAQVAIADVAARMGTDLQAATIMVGKALNDPVKGLAALKRVGIQFTEQQKDQIATMVEAGNVTGAQTVMLKELERQFGGAAAAARKADPFGALKQDFNEFQETVGGQLLKVMPQITGAIDKLLTAFNTLSPGMQQGVVIAGVLAAAFGPLLVVLGSLVSAMAPIIAAVSAAFAEGGVLIGATATIEGFAAALAPVLIPLAAFAAAAYLIYQNWDKIAPVLQEAGAAISQAISPGLTELVTAATQAWQDFANSPAWADLKSIIASLGELEAALLKPFGPAVIAGLKVFGTIFSNLLSTLANQISSFSKLMHGDFVGAFESAIKSVNALFGGLPAAAIDAMQKLVLGVTAWVVTRLNAVWDQVKAKIEAVKGFFHGLYDAVVGHSYVPDMVDGIAAQMLRLDDVLVGKAKSATAQTKAHFEKLRDDLKGLLDRLYPEAAALNQFRANQQTIEDSIKAGKLTPEQGADASRRLAMEGRGEDNPLATLNDTLATDAPELKRAVAEVSDQLDVFGKRAKLAAVQVAKSFKDMADDTLSALNSLATSIKGGGFLDILSSVIGLGLQLGSIGLFGKKVQTNINAPKFAMGTNFAPGGLALVGERGPELVNLPRGSRVFPNGNGPGGNVVNINADFRGADAAAVPRIEAALRQLDRSLEGRSIAAVADARERRIIR